MVGLKIPNQISYTTNGGNHETTCKCKYALYPTNWDENQRGTKIQTGSGKETNKQTIVE